MNVTKSNIKDFVGLTVDCNRRLHHYYPLTIRERNGQYYYVDASDTWIVFNDKDVIYYDTILKSKEIHAMDDVYKREAYWACCPLCDEGKCIDHTTCKTVEEFAEHLRSKETEAGK